MFSSLWKHVLQTLALTLNNYYQDKIKSMNLLYKSIKSCLSNVSFKAKYLTDFHYIKIVFKREIRKKCLKTSH